MTVPAHILPYLDALCRDGARPIEWNGQKPDRTLPDKIAKRLEQSGLIERRGPDYVPTQAGKRAVGRAC